MTFDSDNQQFCINAINDMKCSLNIKSASTSKSILKKYSIYDFDMLEYLYENFLLSNGFKTALQLLLHPGANPPIRSSTNQQAASGAHAGPMLDRQGRMFHFHLHSFVLEIFRVFKKRQKIVTFASPVVTHIVDLSPRWLYLAWLSAV